MGGTIGDSFDSGLSDTRAGQFLAQIEPVLPGLSKEWNGRATIDYRFGLRVGARLVLVPEGGQYTAFAGIEGRQEGNAHFCGEQYPDRLPGLPQRRGRDGERAAAEIVAELK